MRRVGKINNGTAVVDLVGTWTRGGEHVAKNGGLRGQQATKNTEADIAGNKDDAAVVEPKLVVALEFQRRSLGC